MKRLASVVSGRLPFDEDRWIELHQRYHRRPGIHNHSRFPKRLRDRPLQHFRTRHGVAHVPDAEIRDADGRPETSGHGDAAGGDLCDQHGVHAFGEVEALPAFWRSVTRVGRPGSEE